MKRRQSRRIRGSTYRYLSNQDSGSGGGSLDPSDITGLLAWYDFSDSSLLFTDAGVTNVSNDGDLIYQANDKSGNGASIKQVNEGNRPQYKLNRQNGIPAMYFPSSGTRHLGRSGTLGLTGNPEICIFIVMQADVISGNDEMFLIGDEKGLANVAIKLASDASFRYNYSYEQFSSNLGNWVVTCWYRPLNATVADGELYINNQKQTVSDSSGDTDVLSLQTESVYVGKGRSGHTDEPYYGSIGEIIISSADNRFNSNIWNYLNNKWNIY